MTAAPPPRGVSPAIGVHVAMAAFVASAMAGVWPAADGASAAAQAQVIQMGGAAYLAAWVLARRRSWRQAVLVAIAAAGAVFGLWVILQYRYLAPPEVKLAALDAIGRAVSAPFPQLVRWAPFANSTATLLEALVAVAAGLALGHGSPVRRVSSGAAAIVMAAACFLTASRGAWMAVAASLAALAGYQLVARWRLAIALTAAAAVLGVVAGTVAGGTPWWMSWAALAGRPDRLDVYGYAAALLRDMPVTGLGGGDQFAAAVSKHVLLIQVPFITYAHNLTLQLWLAFGLAGLAAWAALAAATAVAVGAGEAAGLGRRFRGVWAGLLAVHVHGLSDARQFIDPWTWAPFFVLTGVLAAAVGKPECRVRAATAWSPLAIALGVVLAAGLGRGAPAAAWQVNAGAVAQGKSDRAVGRDDDTRSGERARAVAHFERALQAQPDDGPALRRLGLLALDEDRHVEALRLLARAWAAEPGHLPTRKGYGLAAVWAGDIELAADVLAPVNGIGDELITWSRYRRDRGELPAAVAAARTALAIEPEQRDVAAWLAQLEREAGVGR